MGYLCFRASSNSTQKFSGTQFQGLTGGTHKLCLRTNTGTNGVVKYPLTTNTSASNYCKLKLNIDGKQAYIAMQGTATTVLSPPTYQSDYRNMSYISMTSSVTARQESSRKTVTTATTWYGSRYVYNNWTGTATRYRTSSTTGSTSRTAAPCQAVTNNLKAQYNASLASIKNQSAISTVAWNLGQGWPGNYTSVSITYNRPLSTTSSASDTWKNTNAAAVKSVTARTTKKHRTRFSVTYSMTASYNITRNYSFEWVVKTNQRYDVSVGITYKTVTNSVKYDNNTYTNSNDCYSKSTSIKGLTSNSAVKTSYTSSPNQLYSVKTILLQ